MEQVSYIHVDSRNRDTALFPFSNTYTVFLNTPITNVTRVDLVSAIVTNPFSTGNAFIWLDITELRTPSTYDARKLTLTNVGPLASVAQRILTISAVVTSTSIAANQVFTNIASTATGNGTDARFTVVRNGAGVPTVTLVAAGSGYSVGNTITLAGATVGGSTPTDNITFTVATIGTNQIQRNQTSSQTPATSFAVIPIDVAQNFQRTFRETSDYAYSVTYPSRLDTIERLTVRWADYTGATVTFGTAGSTTYDPNMFVLRVYTQIVPTTPERPLSLPPPVGEGLFEDKSRVYLGALATLIIGLMMIMLTRRRRT
jgi:hypothetical protein